MKTKTDNERFVFADGGWQDFPNETINDTVAVVPMDLDLTTVKYENGEMVPLTADDLAAKQSEQFNETMLDYEARIDIILDDKARERGYDSIKTAVTYADEPTVAKFQAEGQAFRKWRSLVYVKSYEMVEAAKTSGTIPTFDEVLAQLPAFELDPIVTP